MKPGQIRIGSRIGNQTGSWKLEARPEAGEKEDRIDARVIIRNPDIDPQYDIRPEYGGLKTELEYENLNLELEYGG